jgi:hypothetical protein
LAIALVRSTDPTFLASNRDVRNLKGKMRKEFLGGRSMIDAFFASLDQSGHFYKVQLSPNNEIINLFISHHISIGLAQKYSKVLLMDCTCKTNQYRMPLLNIVGITPNNKSFFVALCFMKQKEQDDYEWVLKQLKCLYISFDLPGVISTDRELALMNAIDVEFPEAKNLLCLWHINNALTKHCKALFATGDGFNDFLHSWMTVCNSETMQVFDANWAEMQSTFGNDHTAIIYLQNTWIVHKEKFVSAWVDTYLHLGSKNTSRVEGANNVIKLYLNRSSVGDLQTVHEKFTLAVINQKRELEILQLSEGQKSPIFAKQKLYTNLNGKVTHFALRLIHQQHKKMLLSMDREEQPLKPCQQIFERTMGLPCAHCLFDIIAAHDGVIPLVEVNDFWQYNPNEMSFVPQLEPPMITDGAAAVIFEIQEQLPEVNQVSQQAVQHHL